MDGWRVDVGYPEDRDKAESKLDESETADEYEAASDRGLWSHRKHCRAIVVTEGVRLEQISHLTFIFVSLDHSMMRITEGEGENVLVYAYRAADAKQWDAARCYCRDCGPDRISAPTLGTSEILVGATLGTVADVRRQTHYFCLIEVDRDDASPPTEGMLP